MSSRSMPRGLEIERHRHEIDGNCIEIAMEIMIFLLSKRSTLPPLHLWWIELLPHKSTERQQLQPDASELLVRRLALSVFN